MDVCAAGTTATVLVLNSGSATKLRKSSSTLLTISIIIGEEKNQSQIKESWMNKLQ